MGAKVLNTYRGYSASDIDTRASDTCDHTIVTSTVECTNVKASKVSTLLSAGSYSLATLCTHANINHYSGFGPTLVTLTDDGTVNGVFNFNNPTNIYSLGSFAGYNHSAQSPGWTYSPSGRIINVVSGEQADIWCDCIIGEPKYTIDNTADVVFTLWDNADLTGFVGYDRVRLNTLKDYANLDYLTTYLGGVTSNKQLYSAIFICNDTVGGFQGNGSNIYGMVPNTSVVPVLLRVATTIGYGGGNSLVSFNNKGNWYAGIISVDNYGLITISELWNILDGDNNNLQIAMSISGTGVTNSSKNIWRTSVEGTYYANYNIGPITHQCADGNLIDTTDWAITISFGSEI